MPMERILVYLEPCIFRDDPLFLRGHYDAFIAPILRALASASRPSFIGFASNIFLALEGLACARSLPRPAREVRIYPLYNSRMLRECDFSIEGYASDVFDAGDSPPRLTSAFEQVASIVDDVRPDTVITTSQNKYLRLLAAKTGFSLLSVEFGPLPRIPFPANRFVSLDGHLSDGILSSPARAEAALASVQHSASHVPGLTGLEDFEAEYLRTIAHHPQYGAVRKYVTSLRERYTVSLLALQPEQWVTWEGALGTRRSAVSIIHSALAGLRTDKLIVTFHVDPRGRVAPGSLREIWLSDPRLELLPDELSAGLSELFLPFVDELITVSSNLGMSGILLGKPIRAIGKSYVSTLAELSSDREAADLITLRDKVLRYVATRMTVDDATFQDPALLHQHLVTLSPKLAASATSAPPGDELVDEHTDHLREGNLEQVHTAVRSKLSAASPAQLLATFGRHALGYLLEEGAVGAEFGVARGYFSESLLRSGRIKTLLSVDSWSDHHNDEEFAFAQSRLAQFGDASRILRMSFENATAAIPDGSLDFIYVDGYAHTGHDADVLRSCIPKLKPGAIVASHDYDKFSWPINYRCLGELFATDDFTDVQRIPSVLTLNNEDIFPGVFARYCPR